MFDGSNRAGSCWGNHFPSPPFYYYVDECVYDGSSLSGPTLIYSTVRGEYDHRVPLSPFGRGIFKKCVNSQAVYPLSEQHGLEAQDEEIDRP